MIPEDVGRLIEQARREDDGERRWALLVAVTQAGPAVVRPVVECLLQSQDAEDAALGADLVAAMPSLTDEEKAHARAQGWPLPDVTTFDEVDREAIAALVGRTLREASDPNVVQSCVIAAGKLQHPGLLEAILAHVADADPEVREACAWSLSSLEPDGPSERAIAALVALADDPVDAVRDWALAGLGALQGQPIDTPESRRVFWAHADDSYEGARKEAVRALGLLGDVELLARSLEYDLVGPEALEVAIRLKDPRLHKPLLDLRERECDQAAGAEPSRDFDEMLSAAIDATDPAKQTRR